MLSQRQNVWLANLHLILKLKTESTLSPKCVLFLLCLLFQCIASENTQLHKPEVYKPFKPHCLLYLLLSFNIPAFNGFWIYFVFLNHYYSFLKIGTMLISIWIAWYFKKVWGHKLVLFPTPHMEWGWEEDLASWGEESNFMDQNWSKNFCLMAKNPWWTCTTRCSNTI
jgi:hypothetical protein